MNKLKLKRLLIAFIIVISIPILIFCIISIGLTTRNINGFVGTMGVIRLTLSGRDYIELGNDPTIVLFRHSRYIEGKYLGWYFDEHFEGRYWIRNGNKYYVDGVWSAFTRRYGFIRVYSVQ